MASLALGVVGAVIGSFFPGVGTAVGWALGSALGSLLEPPKQQTGPRISDLKLQGSSYGSFIGIPYGTVRLAGEVIWQTDLVEHSHTQSSGKGGGTETTTFSYTCSFAIQICEGPVAGVFKVWADGRLVLSIDKFGARDGDLPITVYLGTESQQPDPTMEAVEGVGLVPAHRGYCYVVFTDLDLSDYGNRIPVFTFEVSTSHGNIPWRVSTFTNPNNWFAAGPIAQGAQNGQIEDGQLVIGTYTQAATGSLAFEVSRYSLDGTLLSTDDPVIGETLDERLHGGSNSQGMIQCQNNYHIAVARLSASGNTGNTSAFYYDGIAGIKPIHPPLGTDNQSAIMGKPYYYKSDAADPVEYIFGTGGNVVAFLGRWRVTDGVPSSGTPGAHYFLPGDASGWSWFVTVDDNSNVWCFGPDDPGNDNGQLLKFDLNLNLLYRWRATDNPLPSTVHCFVVFNDTILFPETPAIFAAYYINDDNTFTRAGGTPATFSNIISLGGGLGLTADGVVSINPPAQGELLSQIVGDTSERCGLANLYDVDELTDTVDGFLIGSQMTGRAAIEALMPVYFFDAVESDGLVKYVKRGHDPVATITAAELSAMPDGSTRPAPLETVRGSDSELPAIINVVYMNAAADYQTSTQTQRRQTGGSKSPITMELPMVLSDVKAKQVVDSLLFHPWLERNRRSFRTTRKYLALEPTDVVTVDGLELRITQKTETGEGVVHFDALPALTSIFSQPSVAGASSGFTTPSLPRSQATQCQLLDIPLVNDDDSEGFYVAMAGQDSDSWRGAVLFRSVDGGASYSEIARSNVADTIGTTSTILGDFLGGDLFDEMNSVTVVIGAGGGELAGTTALAVMNGANKALVGSEIIQYRDVSLIAASTYVLSGLLRGRRGTEWAIGTHGVNERFIALPTSINVASTELNVSRLYKAVTIGRTLAGASAVTFANTGSSIRPYAPVYIGGGFNGSGDCIVTWIRRSRIGGDWVGYVDAALSEESERYSVEVWDSTFTTLKRTISGITSPTTTYTAAQQTSDFGAPQSTVYVKVYQDGRFLPSRGVRAHFPNNTTTWTSDLEPTPGAIPPVAALRTIPFTWGEPGATQRAYSADYGGFSATDSISISFTTPAGTSAITGRITIVEFADPPVERVACFSTVSGDFDAGLSGQPQSKQTGIGISFFFRVGVAAPYTVLLAPSTTYYLNLRNGVTGYESCNIQVTLQQPSGL